jgi:glycosyltransferase involved in cell wall biosynthesis
LVDSKPTLAFVSTRFLFPTDSGGKIRTTQILRGMKGGAFRIRLLMPCGADERQQYVDEIASVCDELCSWDPQNRPRFVEKLQKLVWLWRPVPVPVLSDWSKAAQRLIVSEVERGPDLIVFDFPHSAVLVPEGMAIPSVMFTHNIEAEIFRRHCEVAKSPLTRFIWKNQFAKMMNFERKVLQSFDTTIAVSERDRDFFRSEFGIQHCYEIPTVVDTDFFAYETPDDAQVVFCGSMDWMANIDAVEYFHDFVWPLIRAQQPEARMKVVGRRPPDSLVKTICSRSTDWKFTGFVDDVRDHVAGASAFVIPLRVGGGTRIKAFEAMAMGCPVVSTSTGMEGLPVQDDVHFLKGDTPEEMAAAVVSMLDDRKRRVEISNRARALVESEYGVDRVATIFEKACLETLERAS